MVVMHTVIKNVFVYYRGEKTITNTNIFMRPKYFYRNHSFRILFNMYVSGPRQFLYSLHFLLYSLDEFNCMIKIPIFVNILNTIR